MKLFFGFLCNWTVLYDFSCILYNWNFSSQMILVSLALLILWVLKSSSGKKQASNLVKWFLLTVQLLVSYGLVLWDKTPCLFVFSVREPFPLHSRSFWLLKRWISNVNTLIDSHHADDTRHPALFSLVQTRWSSMVCFPPWFVLPHIFVSSKTIFWSAN